VKLYYWRYKFSCGEEACVAAASLEESREALCNSLNDCVPGPGASLKVVEKMLAGDDYELVVLEPGRVVWTERS
jgi:hypothetical protein